MNQTEDKKDLSSTVESSGAFVVSLGCASSSEITTLSNVKMYANSVQEGAEPMICCGKVSLTEENDVRAGINEVLVEKKSDMTYRKNKRLKMTDRVDSAISNSKDSPESEFDKFFNRITGQKFPAEGRISDEAVENTSLAKSSLCCPETDKNASTNDARLFSDKSNDARLVQPQENTSFADNDLVHDVIYTKTDSDEIHHTGDSRDGSSHLGEKEMPSRACNDVKVSDAFVVNANILEEHCDEKSATTSNDEAHNMTSEEENDSKFQSISSCDTTESNGPLHHKEQSIVVDADPCLIQLDEPTNVASQVVSQSVDSSEKKLLVLDVNGLLLSICSYVPYDYDPDDIISRKAVFKRPYCDDFLKFCFEKFNVGIWTSKTKRNMEPIIDFLLGNDKEKLLFCWDHSHCTDTGYYTVEKKQKPLLLKKLKKLWDKYDPDLPWEKGVYNESNTLLIDDSPYKSLRNPQYTAVFPYTYHFRCMSDYSLGPGGDLRVYLEGLALAENVQEYVKQNPFGQRAITERNLSWLYYLKVIEASSTPPRDTNDESCNNENGSPLS